MKKPRRSERDGMWDDRLMCHVQQVTYEARAGVGRLDFPASNCCDMSGALAIFTAIDADVRVIDTYAGGKPDTVYRRDPGNCEWTAFMMRVQRAE